MVETEEHSFDVSDQIILDFFNIAGIQSLSHSQRLKNQPVLNGVILVDEPVSKACRRSKESSEISFPEKPFNALSLSIPQFLRVYEAPHCKRDELMKKARGPFIKEDPLFHGGCLQERGGSPQVYHVNVIGVKKGNDPVCEIEDIDRLIKKEAKVNVTVFV